MSTYLVYKISPSGPRLSLSRQSFLSLFSYFAMNLLPCMSPAAESATSDRFSSILLLQGRPVVAAPPLVVVVVVLCLLLLLLLLLPASRLVSLGSELPVHNNNTTGQIRKPVLLFYDSAAAAVVRRAQTLAPPVRPSVRPPRARLHA